MQDERDLDEENPRHDNTKVEKSEFHIGLDGATVPNGSCVRDGTDSPHVFEDDVALVELNADHRKTMDTLDLIFEQMDQLIGDGDEQDYEMENEEDAHPSILDDLQKTFDRQEEDIEHAAVIQISDIPPSSASLPLVEESDIIATLREDRIDIDLTIRHQEDTGIKDHFEHPSIAADIPSSDLQCRSEILITFSQSCRGQIAYVVIDRECSNNLPAEITVDVQCKNHRPTVFISTFIKDERKLYSYSVFPCRQKRRWRYVWSADKAPTVVSFLVVEDANTSARWETTTYEVTPTLPQCQLTPQSPVQLESDWVLVDCNEHEVELFHQHQNEMSISQSVNYQTLDKSCKVQ